MIDGRKGKQAKGGQIGDNAPDADGAATGLMEMASA
jgi:hypothetical protein